MPDVRHLLHKYIYIYMEEVLLELLLRDWSFIICPLHDRTLNLRDENLTCHVTIHSHVNDIRFEMTEFFLSK